MSRMFRKDAMGVDTKIIFYLTFLIGRGTFSSALWLVGFQVKDLTNLSTVLSSRRWTHFIAISCCFPALHFLAERIRLCFLADLARLNVGFVVTSCGGHVPTIGFLSRYLNRRDIIFYQWELGNMQFT